MPPTNGRGIITGHAAVEKKSPPPVKEEPKKAPPKPEPKVEKDPPKLPEPDVKAIEPEIVEEPEEEKISLSLVQKMIEEALAAQAKQLPTPVVKAVVDDDADDDEDDPYLPKPGVYPVPYYNPKIIDERFYMAGTPYPRRFVKGMFVAQNASEEESVRQCLRAHGVKKPDEWRGNNRKRPWMDQKTGFVTLNENARYDFEAYHQE